VQNICYVLSLCLQSLFNKFSVHIYSNLLNIMQCLLDADISYNQISGVGGEAGRSVWCACFYRRAAVCAESRLVAMAGTDVCGVCLKKVGDKDEAIGCDWCEKWVHVECAGVSKYVQWLK